MLNFYHFLNHECVVFLFVFSLDLNVKNSVIRFFCLSVQISESIIPTRPDNRGSYVTLSLPRSLTNDLVFSSNFFKLSYKISLLKNQYMTFFFYLIFIKF